MAASTWWGEDIIPRIQWRVEVREGEEIPDGYGLAWREWYYRGTVCMPMPLNYVAGALRACRDWLKMGFSARPFFSPRYAEAVAHGERRGLEYGWERGYADAVFDQQFPETYPRQHNPYRCDHCRSTR